MLILSIGDRAAEADDLVTGTLTVSELMHILQHCDDDDSVIVRLDNGFAEIDTEYDTY